MILEGPGYWTKGGRQLGIAALAGQLLCPVEGEIKVTPAVVDSSKLAAGRAVLIQQRPGRTVQGVGKDLCTSITCLNCQLLKGDCQSKELT